MLEPLPRSTFLGNNNRLRGHKARHSKYAPTTRNKQNQNKKKMHLSFVTVLPDQVSYMYIFRVSLMRLEAYIARHPFRPEKRVRGLGDGAGSYRALFQNQFGYIAHARNTQKSPPLSSTRGKQPEEGGYTTNSKQVWTMEDFWRRGRVKTGKREKRSKRTTHPVYTGGFTNCIPAVFV